MSANRCRRALATGGKQALASKGAGGPGAAQLRELEAVLDASPAAWGWQDQCWTLARIAEWFGLSIATVDGRLRRALGRLRESAREELDD